MVFLFLYCFSFVTSGNSHKITGDITLHLVPLVAPADKNWDISLGIIVENSPQHSVKGIEHGTSCNPAQHPNTVIL